MTTEASNVPMGTDWDGVDDEPATKGVRYNNQMSTIDESQNPFAVREGKTLTWKNINMTLVSAYIISIYIHT
jgi:hypothetical protein